ncbi:hypothetical protein BG015_011688 [Linnemannia schmuckeri]|uniref:Uncharacterized protein n=1 Tax=Linnemannia schmuckeri TaxID=64567 RepID=A0A9P5V806_9FUNG|nr:hypothetical protein BG015_011688 [Linnemannia schmuckeri]
MLRPVLPPSQAVQMIQATGAAETAKTTEAAEATGAAEVAVATVHATDEWCNYDRRIHYLPEMAKNGLSYDGVTCPKTSPKVVPIMLVGTGGLCLGLRMGGSLKLGGGRITEQHRQSCPVLMTRCIKTVRAHGAVEYVSGDCESVQSSHTIRGRDDNAAVAIIIAGYSNLTSREKLKSGERGTLLPFEPRHRPKIANPTPSTSDSTGSNSHSEGIRSELSRTSSRCPEGPRL